MSAIMSSPAKRKREILRSDSNTETTHLTFSAPHADDGGSSPRTRVASRFGSLVIEERGAKRVRSDEAKHENDERSEAFTFDTFERSEANTSEPSKDVNPSSTFEQSEANTSEPDTPTLRGGLGDLDSSPYTPIDPLRASLTWQDDEITVYDPNDKDDDGTGVNGIGFRPTPAIAHARALKRRQQLVEYRKREEREARARRSRRRPRVHGRTRSRGRGGSGGGSGGGSDGSVSANAETDADEKDTVDKKKESTRRVRFLETGPVTIRFLEPEVAV